MIDTCYTCHSAGTHRISARLDLSISKRGRKIAESITCDRHVHAVAREFKQRFPGSYVKVLVGHLVRGASAAT